MSTYEFKLTANYLPGTVKMAFTFSDVNDRLTLFLCLCYLIHVLDQSCFHCLSLYLFLLNIQNNTMPTNKEK
jgi:hypothetical protein